MPAQQGFTVENSFINGVVTEATALNFPDKAVVEADNCIFDIDGSVYRRTGLDFERNFSTKSVSRDNNVIQTYLWQNVAGNGNITVVVAQIGDKLYFWETDGTGIFSTGAQTTTVTLTPVSGAPIVNTVEAQFCDGNGYLIVTHPYCEPMRIAYDVDSHTASATNIILQIRDFEGATTDPLIVQARPTDSVTTVNKPHLYNLMNQGWTAAGLSGWDTAQTTMPSNADVMWAFKNTSDALDFTNTTVANVVAGNTPAPRGYFILTLSNQDRVSAGNGIIAAIFPGGSVPTTTTGFQRPSACAFFAGRVFYAGINYVGFNSNIYFSQILENVNQYGHCYQVNDPTAEDLFDLLPTDGGVISIPEAGTVYKMHTVPGGLCVFAANGVWFITGSTGLGFTASDYAVLKIADIPTVSDTSFVNVGGFPAWWNSEGIYLIQQQSGTTTPSVKSLTYDTFKSFYDSIPVPSKRYARGFFDKTDGVIRWLYRSQATTNINEIYDYDRILNFNLRTNAFYPWSISPGDVKVHTILSTELVTRPILINNVIDSHGNNVVDSLGNQVITFATAGSEGQQFDKYLVSYHEGGTDKFTFAERTDDTYLDWEQYEDTGTDYTSYYITGYRLSGGGDRRVSNNWVDLFSRVEEPVEYRFQAIWDFANTGSGTGRWSSNQNIVHSDTNYGNARRRLKVRGHGKALQFRVSSVAGKPFDMLGWTTMQSINGVP